MSIPYEAIQQAIHIAYLAGQRGDSQPTLTWIESEGGGTEKGSGNWLITYPDREDK